MKVAVVGTGLMGMGIAQIFAGHGDDVAMCIVTGKDPEGKAAKFRKTYDRLIRKGRMTQEAADEIISRVKFGGLEIAADADLIIESALENMQAKIDAYAEVLSTRHFLISGASRCSISFSPITLFVRDR